MDRTIIGQDLIKKKTKEIEYLQLTMNYIMRKFMNRQYKLKAQIEKIQEEIREIKSLNQEETI